MMTVTIVLGGYWLFVIIVLVDDWLFVTVVLGDDRLFATVVLGDDKDDPMTRRRGRRPHGGGRWPHHYPGWNADGGRTEGGPHGSLHASSLHASAASVEGRMREQTPAGAEEWFWGPRDAPPSAANHRDQLHMGQMYRNQLHMGQMYREGVAGFHMTETRQFNGWSCMAGRGGAESMGRHGPLHADFRAADPIGTAWELGPSGELPVTLPFTHGQHQGPFPSAAMHQYGLHGPLSQHQPPGYQCSRREDCGPPVYEPLWYGSPHHGPSHGMPPHEGFFQPGSSCPQPPLSQSRHFERLAPDDCHQRPLSPLSYKDMLMGRLRAVQGLLQVIECQQDPDWSGKPRDWGVWRGGEHAQADCGPDRPPRATGGPPQHRGGRGVDRRHRSPAAPAGFPPPPTDVVTDRHPAPSAPRSGSQGPASGWQCDPGAGGNRPLSASQAPRVLSGGRKGRIPTRTDSRATGARGSRAGADRGGSKAEGGRADSSGVQSRDSAASPARRGPSGKAGKRSAGEGRSADKSLAPVSPSAGPWEQGSADQTCSSAAAASSSARPGVDSAATASSSSSLSSSETAKQNSTPASPASMPRPKCSNVLLRTLLSPSVGQTDRTDQRGVAPTEAPAVSQAMTVAELMGEIVDAFARRETRAEQLPVASCATEPTGDRQRQDGTWQGSPTSSAPHNPPGSPQRSELKSAPKEVISDSTERDAETRVFPKLEHDTDVMTLSYANMGGQGAKSPEGRQTSDCTKDAASGAHAGHWQTRVVEVQPVVSSSSFLHCGPAGASPSNVYPSGAGAAGTHCGGRLKDNMEDACFSNNNSQGSDLGLEDLGDICHTCLACGRRFASSTLLEDHLLEHMQFHMDDCQAPEDEEESFAQYDENMGREHPSHLKLEYLVDSELQGTSSDEVHECAPSELSSACELSSASELPSASELSSGPSKTSRPSPRKTSIPTPNSLCDVHKQSPDRSKTTDPELGRVTPGDPTSNKQDSSPSRAVCSGPNNGKSSHPTTSRSGHHKQSPSRAQTAHPKPPTQTSSSSGAARTDSNRQTSRRSKASESSSNKQTPNHSKSPQSCPRKQTPNHSKSLHSGPDKQIPNHSKSSQSRPSKRTPNHSKSLNSGPDKQASNHSKSLHSAPDKQTPNHSKSLHSGPDKETQNHSKSLHSGPDKQTQNHSKSSHSRPNKQTPNHSTSSHSSPDKETPNHSKSSHSSPNKETPNHSKSSHSGPDKETSNQSKSSHTPPDKQKFNNSKSSHACPDKQKKCNSSKSSRCEDEKQASGSDGAESAKRWKILSSGQVFKMRKSGSESAESAKRWKILSSGQVFKMRKSPTSSDSCRYHKQCATEEVRNADFDESNSSELPDCPQASQPPESGPMSGGINTDMPQSAQDPESGPMSGGINPDMPQSAQDRESGPMSGGIIPDMPLSVQDPESGPMSGRIKNSTSVEWFPTVPKSSESRGLKRLHSGPEAPETVDALPVKVRKRTGLVADAQSGKKRHVSADDADCAKVKDRGALETVVYRNRLRYVRDLCRPLSVVLERVSAEETKPPATRGEAGLLRQPGSGTRGPPTTHCPASEPRGNTESDHELQHSANPAFISKEQTFVYVKESAPSQGNPASESEECCGGSGPEDFCDRAAASSSDKSSESTDNDTGFIFCTQCFSVFTNRQVFEAHACYLRRHDEESETDEDDEEPEEDSGRDCAHVEANEEALDDNNDDELTDGDNPWHSLKIGSRTNRQSRGSRKRKPAKEASIETHKAPTPSAPKKGGRVKGRGKKTVTSPSRDDHMFTCSRCDQKFFSRAGLLFHWQHLHKKLPASTRLSS